MPLINHKPFTFTDGENIITNVGRKDLTFQVGQNITIPCIATHPDVKITLTRESEYYTTIDEYQNIHIASASFLNTQIDLEKVS